MKRSTFGALAAGAVLSLLGAGVASAAEHEGEAKACYRKQCGKSIKGHEGKCGGTKVDALADEASCTAAGGAWTTATDAKQYEKKKEG